MKKVLSLIALMLALTVGLSLAACGDKPQTDDHTHTFETAWTTDATYHWHKATCEHTGEVSEKAEHTFVNGVCSVCGATQPLDGFQGEFAVTVNGQLVKLVLDGHGAGTYGEAEIAYTVDGTKITFTIPGDYVIEITKTADAITIEETAEGLDVEIAAWTEPEVLDGFQGEYELTVNSNKIALVLDGKGAGTWNNDEFTYTVEEGVLKFEIAEMAFEITKDEGGFEIEETNEYYDCSIKVAESSVHEHTYHSEFTYNSTQHWHKASCEHEVLATERENHNLENGICTVCGYQEKAAEGLDGWEGTYSFTQGDVAIVVTVNGDKTLAISVNGSAATNGAYDYVMGYGVGEGQIECEFIGYIWTINKENKCFYVDEDGFYYEYAVEYEAPAPAEGELDGWQGTYEITTSFVKIVIELDGEGNGTWKVGSSSPDDVTYTVSGNSISFSNYWTITKSGDSYTYEDDDYNEGDVTYTAPAIVDETLDGWQGTYTCKTAFATTELVIDGKGAGTYGGTAIEYTVSGNTLSFTCAYEDYTITKTAGGYAGTYTFDYEEYGFSSVTYSAKVEEELDGWEGTYTCVIYSSNNTLVLDGKGAGTYNGTDIEYTVNGDTISFECAYEEYTVTKTAGGYAGTFTYDYEEYDMSSVTKA